MLVWGVCVLLSGCTTTPTFKHLPPVVSVVNLCGPELRGSYGCQGVLVGTRLLTCIHVFLEERAPFPPTHVLVDWFPLNVASTFTGDVGLVRQLPWTHPSRTEFLTNDWAALEVNEIPGHPASPNFEWDRGRPCRGGETLWAFKVHSNAGEKSVTCQPLQVVTPTENNVVPPELIATISLKQVDTAGYSGSFVGRYHEDRLVWEFVGILVAASPEILTTASHRKLDKPLEINWVIRPPAHAVEWLLHQDAKASAQDLPAPEAPSAPHSRAFAPG
ncbi:MAG: hypothetical protein U0638_09800 [Phycisphaerales bacterium]